LQRFDAELGGEPYSENFELQISSKALNGGSVTRMATNWSGLATDRQKAGRPAWASAALEDFGTTGARQEIVPFIPPACASCQTALPPEAGPNDPPPVRQ
jgi:hypothetical protein